MASGITFGFFDDVVIDKKDSKATKCSGVTFGFFDNVDIKAAKELSVSAVTFGFCKDVNIKTVKQSSHMVMTTAPITQPVPTRPVPDYAPAKVKAVKMTNIIGKPGPVRWWVCISFIYSCLYNKQEGG